MGTQREEKRQLRLARMAVNNFFLLNGLMNATFSTRLPTVQMKLALPPGQLGWALLGCTSGGLLATNIAGHIASRFGSKMITTIAALSMCITLLLVGIAPALPFFCLTLVLFGAAGGAMEVTMNLQGAAIERAYGCSIMNSFHAYFSLGSLSGALLGSTLAALNVQPELHFSSIGLVSGIALVCSARFLFSARREQIVQMHPTKRALSLQRTPTLIRLRIIAFCSFLGVGAMFDWSAVYLSGTLHTGAGLAAAGFTTFLACMVLGRSVGDSLVMRFGIPILLWVVCILAASGLILTLICTWIPIVFFGSRPVLYLPRILTLICTWIPIVFFGLGLVGIGLAVPFPLVLSAASQQKNSALATVSTWGYCGLIIGPAMIGFLADRVGVRLALAPVALLCVVASFCSPAREQG